MTFHAPQLIWCALATYAFSVHVQRSGQPRRGNHSFLVFAFGTLAGCILLWWGGFFGRGPEPQFRWPQLIWLILIVFAGVDEAFKHGSPRDAKYNPLLMALSTALAAMLLYWGGFFGGTE